MEFFKYSIGPASLEHGSAALDGVFKQFDKDGDGSLDFKELSDAADTIGMGGLANDILNAFMQTDRDRSGGITYGEMLEELRRASRADSRTILLLTTLIWGSESSKPEQSCKVLELAKTWRIKSRDAPALHAELQELLRDTGCHVADLLALFDHDALVARSVDDVEFLAGLKSFGYKGSAKVASDVFKMIDKSGDGQIGFDELFEFIRGRRHCLDRRNVQVRQMRLQPPPGVSSLENVVWDVETLRILLQQMLARYGVSIGELMSSWDRNGDFTVQRLEFLDGVRGFCSEYERVQLWEREVAKVALEAFTRINASPRGRSDAMSRHRADVLNEAIECSELGRWLERPTLRAHSTQVITKRREPTAHRAPERRRTESTLTHLSSRHASGRPVSPPGSGDALTRFGRPDWREQLSPRSPRSPRSPLPPLKPSPNFRPWSPSLNVPWSRPMTSRPMTTPSLASARVSSTQRVSSPRRDDLSAVSSSMGLAAGGVGAIVKGLPTGGAGAYVKPGLSPEEQTHMELVNNETEYALMRQRLLVGNVLGELDWPDAERSSALISQAAALASVSARGVSQSSGKW